MSPQERIQAKAAEIDRITDEIDRLVTVRFSSVDWARVQVLFESIETAAHAGFDMAVEYADAEYKARSMQ